MLAPEANREVDHHGARKQVNQTFSLNSGGDGGGGGGGEYSGDGGGGGGEYGGDGGGGGGDGGEVDHHGA